MSRDVARLFHFRSAAPGSGGGKASPASMPAAPRGDSSSETPQAPPPPAPPGRECFRLFGVFLKIGLFTLGGGYAMIPLMERELVADRRWLRPDEFVDMIAVAQSIPGMLALNAAVFAGYKRRGTAGALAAGAGVLASAFFPMLLLVMFVHDYQDHPAALRVFSGVRPAVAALVATAAWDLARKAGLSGWKWGLAALAAAWTWGGPTGPTWLVALAAIGGACLAGRTSPPPSTAAGDPPGPPDMLADSDAPRPPPENAP